MQVFPGNPLIPVVQNRGITYPKLILPKYRGTNAYLVFGIIFKSARGNTIRF